jgi:hypothetical protein
MRLAEIGFSAEFQKSVEEIRERIDQAVTDLTRATELLAEANNLNFRAKRLLLENARLMRKLIGLPGALHIADEEGESDANGRTPEDERT